MKDIKIGAISFNTEVLQSCSSIKEAQERFKNRDKEVVKQAFNEAKAMKKESEKETSEE